ncbi:MAG TPA: PKD domain-containing protein, partial [Gammaproteobacteria bacterium]|nr:PKD domain-containing protein [Gammaproteobacteria bacterium]
MRTQSDFSSMKYRLFTSLWLIAFTLLLLLSGCRPFDNGGGNVDSASSPNPPVNTPVPVANQQPEARFSVTPASGEAPLDVSLDASGSTDDDGSIASYAWDFGDGGNASGETVSHTYTTAGTFTITLTVTDDDGDSDTASQSINIAAAGSLPPNPASIAPPLDKTRPVSVYDSTAFLYTGSNPVQTGVAEDTIVQRRAAVLRGKVMDRDGQPLPGVTVTILDHPELGQTLTRADGLFDLVVNGGGHLTVNYRKPGYLVAQRRIKAPWNDYAWLPDVALVELATESSTLDLASNEPVQVLQGPLVSDDRGERRTTLLVSRGTHAQMIMADGSTREFTSDTLTVRATEFTVGKNGPDAMPGELPPGVGYTYAVELSIDEAETAGATSVKFDKPLYQYVENFIGFPVGDEAPLYYYNRQSGNWEQEEAGIVIKILDIVSGMANIDTDGDNQPEDNDTLNSLGFTDEERTTLASLYPTDTSLWRMRITHFSPYDTNWFNLALDEVDDAINNIEITEDEPETNSCNSRGSIIDCQNQTLGERIPITGTPFSLNYRSFRMPGYQVGQGILIRPLDNMPLFIKGIQIRISTAGQRTEVYFDSSQIISTPELSYRYIWDGLDAYGRPVTGEVPTIIQFIYEYSATYLICRGPNNIYCPPSPPREIQTRFAQRTVILNKSAPPYQNEGGWSLSPHHRYSKKSATLHEGNGNSHSALPVGVLAAGNYAYLPGNYDTRCADGDPALGGCHLPTEDIAILTDGSLIVTDEGYGGEALEGVSVRKVDPNGVVSTLISSVKPWDELQEGDLWFFPSSLATGPDNSVYVGDCDGGHRVLKIDSNGEVSVYAGTGGNDNFSGDGGPATAAQIGCPLALATGPDGSLYIANGFRIRKVNPQGIINTIAGGGTLDSREDGVRAVDVDQLGVDVMAVADDGTLYLGMYNRIRKIDPTGIIWTVAGNGSDSISGDGGPAVEAGLGEIHGLAVADDGSLYVSAYAWINDNQAPSVIRKITPNGIIDKLPGTDTLEIVDQTNGYSYPVVHNMTIGPDGGLYAAVKRNYGGAGGVYRFNGAGYHNNETLIASQSGDEIYRFEQGRHTETLSSYTGATLYRFTYNTEGLLIGITDADGKKTVIERDTEGKLTAIVAPGGQRTVLSVNSDGYLDSISNPAGDTITFRYGNGGLLASMSDAEDNITSFGYDSDGRLVRDTDAAGGEQILARINTPTGYHVTRTTASGAQTTYMVDQLPTGVSRFINEFANGSRSVVNFNPDGSQNVVTADGTTSVMSFGSDPRFGMQSPILSSQLLSTPGGLQTNISQHRNVQLEDRVDPLSLISLSDTTSINGQDFLKLFDATTREWIATSPAGRSVSEIINDSGRPIRSQIAGLDATVFTYDGEGRLISSVRGSGASRQRIDLEYNQAGLLSRIEDNSGNITGFEYDAADHLIRHTLPAERE